MAGKGQPPPAAWPRHLIPLLPGLRGRSAAAATVLPPLPFYSDSSQHSPLPATILHEMFNTCVARGIAAKLVQKTVDGKVEVNLHCSTMTPPAASAAEAAAASDTLKRKRKRPNNERRRTRREAWRQRCSAAAAAAKSASGPAAAAVTTDPGLMQPAAMPAAMPPHAWAGKAGRSSSYG
jgi:hypothetical protein